jgi:hypothetical protein
MKIILISDDERAIPDPAGSYPVIHGTKRSLPIFRQCSAHPLNASEVVLQAFRHIPVIPDPASRDKDSK